VSGRNWKRTFRLEPFGGGLEDALDEELRFHLEERIDQLMADGLSEPDARAEAERALGGLEEHRRRAGAIDDRRARRMKRQAWWDALGLDLRQALRGLRRTPGFTFLAIALMAVGIGGNTTIFSVAEPVLLAPLPFPEPDRLLRIWERSEVRGMSYISFSSPNFVDLRERNRCLEDFGAYTSGNAVLTGAGEPLQIRMGRASAGFLRVLGLQPVLGRAFRPEEDADGAPQDVVLLSSALWRSRFGERPDILGQSLTLDGRPFTVVGVLPDGEYFLSGYDLWVPLGAHPSGNRGNKILWAFGRLRDGITFDQAQNDLDTLARQIAAENALSDEWTGVTLMPISRYLIGNQTRTTIAFLLAAVGLLLLIACANLAHMLLARGTRRRREIAITAALGAGRGRITRQVLTEALLLSGTGGVIGTALAVGLVHLLKVLEPAGLPRLDQVAVDPGALGFTLGVTVLVGLLAGLIPALQAPVVEVGEVLQEGQRSDGGRERSRARNLLVTTEMVLSTVLLIGSGLMMRSLLRVQGIERGFEVEDRLLFDVTLPESHYGEIAPRRSFFEAFTSAVEGIPSVTAIGAVSSSPLDGLNTNMDILREGQVLGPDERMPLADWRYVTPEYFRALGLPLLRGRLFADLSEAEAAPLVDFENHHFRFNVVISEGVARLLWPDEEAVGRTAQLWASPNYLGTVIGVVGDMRERGLEEEPSRAVYFSYTTDLWNPVTFVVHAGSDPEAILPTVRGILAQIDPDLPITDVRRLEDLLGATLGGRRFNTLLLFFFAVTALLLAGSGIYGVMAGTVNERLGEIAVRMALGAAPDGVLALFVRQGLRRVLPGVVLGLAVAVGGSRLIASLLYDVSPLDVPTYGAVALVVTALALVAIVVPAWRATRVDPVTALRRE
jgi:putative ABC transport system permease protein